MREGYAQVYTVEPDVKYTDRLLAAQEKVKAEGLRTEDLPGYEQCQLEDHSNVIGGGLYFKHAEGRPSCAFYAFCATSTRTFLV